jgi:hypothetical protein
MVVDYFSHVFLLAAFLLAAECPNLMTTFCGFHMMIACIA